MFNTVTKENAIANEILFSVDDPNLPTKLIQLLAFNYINITSQDSNGNPIIPTAGEYHVFVKPNPEAGFEATDKIIKAGETGSTLMPNGDEQSAFYGSIVVEIKIVPVGIIGATTYSAHVRQVDRAQRPSIPNDLYTTNLGGKRRIEVSAISREEISMAEGLYFAGATERLLVVINGAYYSVIETGSKSLVIEDVIVTTNFANVTDGHMNLRLNVYVDISNGNDWTYTPVGAPSPLGRPVNTSLINAFPLSMLNQGVTINTLTGNPDYTVYQVDYYLDVAGNRNSKSTDKTEFFAGSRKIIVPPNSSILVETLSSGDAGGTYDLNTLFFVSELEAGT